MFSFILKSSGIMMEKQFLKFILSTCNASTSRKGGFEVRMRFPV
jgi:hypothetical protein